VLLLLSQSLRPVLYNKSMFRFKSKQAGITLVEVVVAIAIVGVMLAVVGFSVLAYLDARSKLLSNMKTMYLAEEGYEILRALRDEDWNTISGLAVDTTYYLSVSTTTLATTTAPEVIDAEYYRAFELKTAYRDGDDDLTDTPGTSDSETRIVKVYAWGPTPTTTMTAILTNIKAI
jgi:prepilin-type N-terminal cleavage/methylation domain-containing protein